MAKTKFWDIETQKAIKGRFYHVDGILYHLKDSVAAGFRKEGSRYKKGDVVRVRLHKEGYLYFTFYNNGHKLNLFVHRVVWFLEYGTQVELIDHIDQDKTNNRPSNMREATEQQNQFNVSKKKACHSKYKGVSLSTSKKKPWKAYIVINRKNIHLGYFETEVDAAKAYDRAAHERVGEYAYLNFPKRG